MTNLDTFIEIDTNQLRLIVNFLPSPMKYMILDEQVWRIHTGHDIRTDMTHTPVQVTQRMMNEILNTIEDERASSDLKQQFVENTINVMSEMLYGLRRDMPEYAELANPSFRGIDDEPHTFKPSYIGSIPLNQ